MYLGVIIHLLSVIVLFSILVYLVSLAIRMVKAVEKIADKIGG